MHYYFSLTLIWLQFIEKEMEIFYPFSSVYKFLILPQKLETKHFNLIYPFVSSSFDSLITFLNYLKQFALALHQHYIHLLSSQTL